MYLHLRVDVHSGTRTQCHSLQTSIALSNQLLSPDSHLLVQWGEFKFTWCYFICIFSLRFKTEIGQSCFVGIYTSCA
ncbi:unnamed protein product [Schistosoma curassoni]|uniref:Ovule protein n=1 Tax=Schistosoma curassoni TaxID=6186 RepID=A0A183JZR2_9TREM|nr:unnamed protein product [Schistosoma curassoni]